MLRLSKRLSAGVVAGAALLGAAAQALGQAASTTTTTTPTTSTTTTTLQPHPFSPATESCIDDAERAQKTCNRSGGTTCRADFETAYPQCFAPGAGVSCAKSCITKETSCFNAVPATKKKCRKGCRTTLTRDIQACRRIAVGDTIWAGGDGSCLTTAQANRQLCGFVCSQAKKDCQTSLTFCVANCPNL